MSKTSFCRNGLVAILILLFSLILLPGLISCGANPNQISVSTPIPSLSPAPTSSPSLNPAPTTTPYESHHLSWVMMRLEGMEVEFGDSASAIIEAYGSPSHDEMLPDYNPRVVRSIIYNNLGLKFTIDRDHLCSVHVESPFAESKYGVRIGDTINQVTSVLGTQKTYENREIDGEWYQGYIWEFAEFERDENELDEKSKGGINYEIELRIYADHDGKIVFFYIEHPRYCGNWIGIP